MIKGDCLSEAGEAALELRLFPKEAPLLEDQFLFMQQYVEIVASALEHHTFVPTCHGTRRTDIRYKAHSLIHSCRLESKSWQLTQEFILLFFSGTVDRGTEKRMRLFHLESPYTYFPWWSKHVEDNGGVGMEEYPVDDPEIDFRKVFRL